MITNGEGNQTVTVEGAGVNATVIQPDIAQMNGYVHIINRVLGVPFGTVADKLGSDPMLKYVDMKAPPPLYKIAHNRIYIQR